MSNLSVDRSGFRLGRTPVKPEQAAKALRLSAFTSDELPMPPREVDYLAPMGEIGMLGNDRFGCCVFAGMAHLAQSVSAVMGAKYEPAEGEVLDAYSTVTGFRQDDPDTDLGTNLLEALTWWKRNRFCGVEIEGFAKVDHDDWRKTQQGLWLFGGVLDGADLPLIAQRQKKWRVEVGHADDQVRPGGWGGHCYAGHRRIFDVYQRPEMETSNWGDVTAITGAWNDAYVAERYVVLAKGWTPPNAPGFDRDRLLQAMRNQELR